MGSRRVLGLMRSVHFDAQGFTRTYWDFFSAFGLFFSVFLLFAAVLAWWRNPNVCPAAKSSRRAEEIR